MNKTLTMSLAALGVVGMIGGGTFASWTDFQESNDQTIGAGHLQLDLTNAFNDSETVQFTKRKLAPGEGTETRIFLSSIDGESVPNGDLTLTINNLVDNEDLATCTTNSESVAESDADCNPGGEFTEHAEVWSQIYSGIDLVAFEAYQATLPGGKAQCDGYAKNVLGMSAPQVITPLDTWASTVHDLGTNLAPGEGTCVKLTIKMVDTGPGAQDEAQGDYATFDMRFDLTQS